MADQLPPGPRRRWARAACNKVTNHLTISIVVAALVAAACAPSTAQRQLYSYSSAAHERRAQPMRARSGPALALENLENLEPLYERPRVYPLSADLGQQDLSRDLYATDEEFLDQLKEAARYLDEKLVERQHQQQQVAIEAAGFGRGPARLTSGDERAAYRYQEPSYSVPSDAHGADPQWDPQLANSWPILNEAGVEPVVEPESDEASVLVVAPGNGAGSRAVAGAPNQAADYQMLAEQLRDRLSLSTDPRYKQLLNSHPTDHAQANPLAEANNDNQKREAPNSAADASARSGSQQPAPRLTTLLEDEEEDKPVSLGQDESAPTTASYGSVVFDGPAQRPAVADSANGGGSFFGRLYNNAVYYMPFLAQLTNLRQGGASSTTHSDPRPVLHISHHKLDESPQVGTEQTNKTDDGKPQSADNELHAKTNVSVSIALGKSEPSSDSGTAVSGGGGGGGGGGGDDATKGEISEQKQRASNGDDGTGESRDNQQAPNNDKQLEHGLASVRVTVDKTESGSKDEGDNNGRLGAPEATQKEPGKGDALKRNQAPQFLVEDDDSNRQVADHDFDLDQMASSVVAADQQSYDAESDNQIAANRYNLMRHSNLVLPIGSASDVLVRTTSGDAKKEPDSLLGKYIYAPTQHYYLNSVMPPAGAGPHIAPMGHHQMLAGKHLTPNGDIYGSYGDMPMKGAYVYQRERNSLVDKSNDMYFLVMVGAFCVMAMAVVLAAGLFAYRIQQSRKSSQDSEYPTYGVVGPNNMSAKCGAASFVGGYFTEPPSGSSKSGSAKHLPDLYGTPSGTGGSDSGLNSLDKSSSNKKASSVSSLNEHHQSSTSRGCSSNFMAAASQDAARMYHYQHQKQQMIISDRSSGGRQTSASDLDSEDENDDGSYTVYECPGLASAHEMEIKNPLFNDDQSP